MEDGNGRYQLKKKLAQGKVAAVYLAYDQQTGQEVVVKQFSQLWRDAAFNAAFEQTMAAVAALQHEAIAPIHSYGELNGQLYIAMPHYSGGSLAAKLAQGPLPVEKITVLLERLCGALAQAHQAGVVHHHLAAENILFDAYETPYLADFGVVYGETATFVADPHAASPEQAVGQTPVPSTNVYQLGLLLFQMLTGRVPFEAPTPSAILQLHRYAPVPAAHLFNPAVTAPIEKVYQRALAKLPSERFATPMELLQAWQRLKLGAGAVKGVGGVAQTAVSPSQRPQPLPWLLIGVGLLLVLIIGGIFLWVGSGTSESANNIAPSSPATTETLLPAATATPLPATSTPSPTATASPSPVATATLTASPRATATVATAATPTLAATATATVAATATASPTSTLPPALQTITLGPPSGTVQSPISFSWIGTATATYRVVLLHEGQLFAHDSGWLQGLSWTFSIPAEEFGGWSWYVEDQQGSRSATGFFWFDPFPNNNGGESGGNGGSSPTAVPTDVPPPP